METQQDDVKESEVETAATSATVLEAGTNGGTILEAGTTGGPILEAGASDATILEAGTTSGTILEAGTTGVTILEALNADCWRLILDYLTINDLMRSERVSRAWQAVVLEYLQGVHNYRIEYFRYAFYTNLPHRYNDNYRSIKLHGHVLLFEQMIEKMGPYIVKMVANCIDEVRLKVIAECCPNLEELTFYRTFRNVPLEHVKKCKHLKRVVFESCALREDYLNDFITSETLEELAINRSSYVTGRFLSNLKTNLKSLALNSCDNLSIAHVQSAVNYLAELTRLELNDNSIDLQDVQLLLDKTPNLEHLSLMRYTSMESGVLASVSHLSKLRELHLWENENVTDSWLAATGRACPALRTVNVGYCERVSGRGVVALCRARPELTELVVAALPVTDTDLEACARCCSGLRLLHVKYCSELTQNLPARLAWRRARPLQLRLYCSSVEDDNVQYEGLTILWNEIPDPYRPVYYVESDSEPDCDDDYDYEHNYDSDYEFHCADSDEDRDWDDVVEEYLESRDVDY